MSNLKEFIRLTDENNGATYNLVTGEINPKSGYYVALDLNGKTVKYQHPINKVVQNFVLKNSLILSNINTYLGSWIEDGKLFLDIVVRVEDRNEAIKFGKENKQKAIYDANNKTVINL